MLCHKITYIAIFSICKTEYLRHFIGIFVVIPQFICHNKRHNRTVIIYHIRNILWSYSKQNAFFIQHLLCCVKYLFHRSIIIEQISFLCICNMAHTEEFFDRIDIRLILFAFTSHAIFQLYRDRITVNLFNIPAFAFFNFRLQASPGYMVIIGVNGHMLKAGIIALFARFNGCTYAGPLYFSKGTLVKIPYIIQTFHNRRI